MFDGVSEDIALEAFLRSSIIYKLHVVIPGFTTT